MSTTTGEVSYAGATAHRIPLIQDVTEAVLYTYRFDIDDDYVEIPGCTLMKGETGTLFDIEPPFATHIDTEMVKSAKQDLYRKQFNQREAAMSYTMIGILSGVPTVTAVGFEIDQAVSTDKELHATPAQGLLIGAFVCTSAVALTMASRRFTAAHRTRKQQRRVQKVLEFIEQS
jgi:hypothetical protein